MPTLIDTKRTIRAHGLRENDQVKDDGHWWLVKRQLTQSEVVRIGVKDGEPIVMEAPRYGFSVLLARGHKYRIVTYRSADSVVSIIRKKVRG